MGRYGHGQRQGAFGTGFFGGGHGALDGGGIACNHDLSGRVEVDGFDHFILCGFGANLPYLFIFQTQNCRHCAHALRYGRLHQFGA